MKKAFSVLFFVLGVVAIVWGGGMIVYRMTDAQKSADTFLSIGNEIRQLAAEQERQAGTDGGQADATEPDDAAPDIAETDSIAPDRTEADATASDGPKPDGTEPEKAADPGESHAADDEKGEEPAAIASSDTQTTAERGKTDFSLKQQLPEVPLPAEILAYRKLAEQYPDFVGWLHIEGTNIDYPVMRSPDEPERYLHKDFYGQRSYPGTPFMLPSSDPEKPSDNMTIYAHHMKDGTMFGGLTLYEKEEGYHEQPIVQFDSLYRTGRYEIFAVFRTSVGSENEFQYYRYSDFADEAQFQDFVQMAKKRSLYNTKVEPLYGDALLTLSTCDYYESDGRLVVVARQIE